MNDDRRHTSFPWGPIRAVGALVLLHAAVLFFLIGPDVDTARFIRIGGLVAGPLVMAQPWRLLTCIVLHSGPSHLFWNGVSMMVFAVPLILELGYLPAAAIYLAGGLLGGIAGALAVPDGVVLIGSSGAVAGLFGAWVAITLLRARVAPLPRHAGIRVVGVALLVLPSLVTPTTSTGTPISVGAHLGGMVAGLAAGIVLWLLGRVPMPSVAPVARLEDGGERAGDGGAGSNGEDSDDDDPDDEAIQPGGWVH